MDRAALVASTVQPGGRAPAPEGLELLQAFVNTVDREHGPDLLDAPEGLADWLAAHGFALPASIRPGDLERARVAREALRTLLHDHVPGDEAAVLDAAAERAGLRPSFASARLEPQAGGVDAAIGAVLAQAFAALADGTLARLKACPGERCGWAFYDRSPAGSATWCSMRVCGQRAKARAYYARRSATSSPRRNDPSR